MKPGVYRNISEDDYHALDAISNSRLGLFARSPAHFRHGYAERGPTAAMVLGSAFHAKVLTPEVYASSYTVADVDRGTKAGKEEWASLTEQYGERGVIKSSAASQIDAMASAVMAHPKAAELLSVPGERELSVLWTPQGYESLCKSRFDVSTDDFLLDLKTTQDAGPRGFVKSIFQYGYYRQAAFYLWAANTMGLTAKRFYFVAVEKAPPHLCAVYELSLDALQAGLHEAKDLLTRYEECVRTDTWPGYGDDIVTVDLPPYAYDRIYDEES